MSGLTITVLEPTYPQPAKVTYEDVWGHDDRLDGGMVTADCTLGGYDEEKYQSTGLCPIFGTPIHWKSVTVVCPKELSEQVAYWLEFVKGSDCISEFKELEDGKVAFRADYQAW
mgnify:CR=1 FL=1